MKRGEWIKLLRTAWDDADAVSQDMLRPPRMRNLGPARHRELYAEAADTIERLLAAPPDDDGGDGGDEEEVPPWETRANGSVPS